MALSDSNYLQSLMRVHVLIQSRFQIFDSQRLVHSFRSAVFAASHAYRYSPPAGEVPSFFQVGFKTPRYLSRL
jgi:hypothetical protein